jgi:16S rRNA C967 or C1407 C5-methylase (RsmB/RsmF family)
MKKGKRARAHALLLPFDRAFVPVMSAERTPDAPRAKRARVEPENPHFDAYVRNLNPDAVDDILAAMRRPLPTTFRIPWAAAGPAWGRHYAEHVILPALRAVPSVATKELEWFPGGLAYEASLSKSMLKKGAAEGLTGVQALRALLAAEHEAGRIVRQEAVSMVPPLFLDVRPEHAVVDLCAAPGSKASVCVGVGVCRPLSHRAPAHRPAQCRLARSWTRPRTEPGRWGRLG